MSAQPPVPAPSWINRAVVYLAVPVVFLVAWSVADLIIDSTVFVGPVDSVARLVETAGSPRFRNSFVLTMQVLAVAFTAAVVVGAAVGFLLGLSPFWMAVLSPVLQAIYSVPKITLYPLFLVFFGLGLTSRTAFGFLHGFFPMAIVVMGATTTLRMDAGYLKLAASLRMGRIQLIRHILIPGVLPSFMTAVRMCFGLTFLGVLLAEMFTANGGLGHELVLNMTRVRIDHILGQVILIAVIAVAVNAVLRTVETRVSHRMAGRVPGAERDRERGGRRAEQI